MLFNQKNENNISYEELHIRHLNLLIDLKNNEFNNWFYKMALINTLDDLNKFIHRLQTNKNKCIIAIQNKKVIGFIHVYPLNEKKTCLKINEPIIIDNNYSIANTNLIFELIKKAISINDLRTSNWIINSDINNNNLIAATKELGFQPLQEIKLWKSNYIDSDQEKVKNNSIKNFRKVDNTNLKNILNFVKSNESILIRNILDFDEKDIENRNDQHSGYVLDNGEIVFSILKDLNYQNKPIYSLIRGAFLDERLNINLKIIIKNIIDNAPETIFKTYSKDQNLNKCLENLNLSEVKRELILVRNTLIRRDIKNVNAVNKSFHSILKKINPSGDPLPSPMPLTPK